MPIPTPTRRSSRSGPRTARGHRVYAVGDVHGRDDLLAELLGLIEADSGSRKRAVTIIVFLGDLIDRGPASAGVIERLRIYAPARCEVHFLLGNHEEVLLRILGGDEALIADWLRFGGLQCMASYGIEPERLRGARGGEALDLIRGAIPAQHERFLSDFEDTLKVGDYLFVHAGIRPGVPLERQLQSDLRWIRAPFLASNEDHGVTVVHGHTISSEVEWRGNRIGIDTGAYRSGRLTALGLEDGEQWLLQTGPAKAAGE